MGSRRGAGLAAGTLLCCALGLGTPAAAEAQSVVLPTPEQARRSAADLLAAVGARPDRALVSRVPGAATNDELVVVGLDGAGSAQRVEVEQHVVLSGEGDFQVRERGPARAARTLSEESAPVTKFGAVVWQGFTSGDPPRELAAVLTLDPALEQPRLPLVVTTSFTAPGGEPVPLGPGGTVPGPGTVVVEVANRTAQPADLPTAQDAPAAAVAAALDAARTVARAPAGPRLPTAAEQLPARVRVRGAEVRAASQQVPLQLTGTLRLSGTTGSVQGGGTTALPDGASVAGTLSAAPARFLVRVDGPGVLDLDLVAVPALDARTLAPPDGARTWRSWAAGSPDRAARRAALDLLVDTAATGARAAAFSPYLGADLPGTGRTRFHLSFSPVEVAAAVRAPLRPRPAALGVAALAGLLVLTGAGAVWRHS